MDDDLKRLAGALLGLESGRMSAQEFCRFFESLWNLEINKAGLPDELYTCLDHLFDEVAWFSPYPRDQWEYPHYRDEAQIRQAAVPAMRMLGLGDEAG
ncbi:hypothetical protein [uncultured Stenotrophomonas sp.]|uniref:hypothetical protein n=1 Tax=uncultured Stenotrophomonas sp. TaxID=165438 RepID=UPI0028D07003|nr:hypothetical protein [uncultured Stenotrophomonas sp.]